MTYYPSSQFALLLLRDLGEEVAQILAGELPLERLGDPLVVRLEIRYPPFEFPEILEVLGSEHLPLQYRKEDLDLVQPAGMDGRMHQDGVGVPLAEALDGGRPRCEDPLSATQKTRRAER